jgi:hypothetical protein
MFSPFNFDVAFSYTDFYTTLYFLKQRNYRTQAMLAHALTRTRYSYSLNVIISHPVVYKEGLGYLSVISIASRASPPTHLCICNGHPGSELCCVHFTSRHGVITQKTNIVIFAAVRTANLTKTVLT